MKQLLALLALIVLLGGGAVGGLALMGIAPFDRLLVAPEAASEEEAAAPAEGEEERELDVGTIGVPLIEGNEIAARIFVTIALQVPVTSFIDIREQLPALQDAYLHDLMVFLPAHLQDRELPDVEVVRERLAAVTERVLGPSRVRKILIRGIFRR